MTLLETRARLSKATFPWTIFRFLRKQNHNVPRPTIATNPSPPTTPPAIAPALDCELPVVDVGVVAAVVDGDNELETLVPLALVIADEVVKLAVSLASDDQAFSFHRSQPNASVLYLLSSAAATLKLLFVYKGKINFVFSMLYYQIHSHCLC